MNATIGIMDIEQMRKGAVVFKFSKAMPSVGLESLKWQGESSATDV